MDLARSVVRRVPPLLLVTLLSNVALAQGALFYDDFEAGPVFDAGRWTKPAMADPDFFDSSPLAVHRGDAGLRAVQTVVGPTPPGHGAADYFFTSDAGEYHVRLWVRQSQLWDAGTVEFVDLFSNGIANGTVIGAVLQPDGTLYVGGFHIDGGHQGVTIDAGAQVGSWSVVELLARGMGTAAGAHELWVNGQQMAVETGFDWTGAYPTSLEVGINWGDGNFRGIMDFDDVRAGPGPLANSLRFANLPPQTQSGICIPVTVEAVDLNGALAPYPLATTISLIADGGLWSPNSNCSAPSNPLHAPLAALGSSVSAYLLAGAPGTLLVSAVQGDLLPGAAQMPVTAADGSVQDAGGRPNGGRGSLAVGCDCSSSGVGMGVLVALALAGLSRRHRA